jgi:hypothetical protein
MKEIAIKKSITRNKAIAIYKKKFNETQKAAIGAVTNNTMDIKEALKALWQYQLAIKKNPAPDLLPAPADNPNIDKYISSNYFLLIGVCKSIGQDSPLSLLVEAEDCMAHMLSFLKPTSLFPELSTPTDLLPKSLPYTSESLIGSVVEEMDS